MSKLTKAELRLIDRKSALLADVRKGLHELRNSDVVKLGTQLTKEAREFATYTKPDKVVAMDPGAVQLYRALGSVPANIMEGFGRGPSPARTQFLLIARGSAEEAVVHAEYLDWSQAGRVKKLVTLVEALILTTLTMDNDEENTED
jgi:four helix bundle protein